MFGIGALWDAATTVYGTYELMNSSGFFQIAASIAFAIVILAIVGSTLWIWRLKGVFGLCFRWAWGLGIAYDLFTSWMGNVDLLFKGQLSFIKLLLLIGLTLYMGLSPIMWAYVNEQPESDFRH